MSENERLRLANKTLLKQRDALLTKCTRKTDVIDHLDVEIERLTTEVSALQGVYMAAKHHIDVRLPAEPGFDEAVLVADKYYESAVSGTQQ